MYNFKKIKCSYDIGYNNFRLSVLYNNFYDQSFYKIYLKENITPSSFILVVGIKFHFHNIKFYPL